MIKNVKANGQALDEIIRIHIFLCHGSEYSLSNSQFEGVCFHAVSHTVINSHTVGLTSEILYFCWGFICLVSPKDFIGKEEGFGKLKLEM